MKTVIIKLRIEVFYVIKSIYAVLTDGLTLQREL